MSTVTKQHHTKYSLLRKVPSVVASKVLLHYNAGDLLHGLDKIGSRFLLNAGLKTLKSVNYIEWDLENSSQILHNPTMVLVSKTLALKIKCLKFYAPIVRDNEIYPNFILKFNAKQ